MTAPQNTPLLQIRRVVVTGELGCDIRLRKGINVIKADANQGDLTSTNDCGKSLFAELVKYGLGGREPFRLGRLAGKVDRLYLEIAINQEAITIQRILKSPGAKIHVYRRVYDPSLPSEGTDIHLDPEKPFSDFLLEELGIPNSSVSASSSPTAQIRRVSFADILHVLYMNQIDSFGEILRNLQPEAFRITLLQILLGMYDPEATEVSLNLRDLGGKITESEREIENIRAFLMGSKQGNRIDEVEKKANLAKELKGIENELRALKEKMRGETGLVDETRLKLEHTEGELREFDEQKRKMLFKLDDYRALRNSLLADRNKLEKTVRSAYILSSIDILQCPRCLQTISWDMRAREEQPLPHCALCDRPLVSQLEMQDISAAPQAVDEDLEEVTALIERFEAELSPLEKKIQELESRRQELRQMLDEKTLSYVSPFVDELERLLRAQNRVSSEIELVDQRLRQWDRLDHLQQEQDQRKNDQQQLKAKLTASQTRDDARIRRLSEHYESFLSRVGFPQLRTARIDPETLLPLVNGNPYTEDTGSGMLSVKVIAYHYALWHFSLNEKCLYPRFLMIDSPRQFDINEDTYSKVLLQFHHVQQTQPPEFQVVITTRDLPPDMDSYVIERLNSKNRMLLREQGQRGQRESEELC